MAFSINLFERRVSSVARWKRVKRVRKEQARRFRQAFGFEPLERRVLFAADTWSDSLKLPDVVASPASEWVVKDQESKSSNGSVEFLLEEKDRLGIAFDLSWIDVKNLGSGSYDIEIIYPAMWSVLANNQEQFFEWDASIASAQSLDQIEKLFANHLSNRFMAQPNETFVTLAPNYVTHADMFVTTRSSPSPSQALSEIKIIPSAISAENNAFHLVSRIVTIQNTGVGRVTANVSAEVAWPRIAGADDAVDRVTKVAIGPALPLNAVSINEVVDSSPSSSSMGDSNASDDWGSFGLRVTQTRENDSATNDIIKTVCIQIEHQTVGLAVTERGADDPVPKLNRGHKSKHSEENTGQSAMTVDWTSPRSVESTSDDLKLATRLQPMEFLLADAEQLQRDEIARGSASVDIIMASVESEPSEYELGFLSSFDAGSADELSLLSASRREARLEGGETNDSRSLHAMNDLSEKMNSGSGLSYRPWRDVAISVADSTLGKVAVAGAVAIRTQMMERVFGENIAWEFVGRSRKG